MATADPPDDEPTDATREDEARELPSEEADTSALPPVSEPPPAPPVSRPAIQVVPPAPRPLEDAVAGLIDEKPSRPHLTVVPSPDGPGSGAGSSSDAIRRAAIDDDPLAVVLGSRPEEPEAVSDAGAKRNAPAGDQLDVSKLLDISAISGGLRQIASWIEKQIPSLNAAVGKFISSIEGAIKNAAPDVEEAKPAEAAEGAAAASPLTVVPAEPASEREPDPAPSEPSPASRPWIDPATEQAPGEPQSEREPEPPAKPQPEEVTDPAADPDGEPDVPATD